MRKYIALLLIMSVVGGIATVYLIAQSSLAVIINNNTDEVITDLELTYNHIKTDIIVDPIAPGEDIVLKIDPKYQATDEFEEGSLEIHYTDDNGESHTDTVFESFDKDVSGDAEITIQDIDENGVLSLEIEEHLGNSET